MVTVGVRARRWPWPAADAASSFPGPRVMGTPPARYRESVTRLVTGRDAPACRAHRATSALAEIAPARAGHGPPRSRSWSPARVLGGAMDRPKCDHDANTDLAAQEQRS